MFVQFCQFNDITNIQNDTFCKEMREFTPKSLIISVVAETESLNDYKPQLKFV